MNNSVYLKKVPLFSDVKESDLKRLQKIGKVQKYRKTENIFTESASGDCFYVVLSGRVKIFAQSGEKKKTLAYLEKGEHFGEMALLDLEPRSASSQALDDCELLVIKKSDFRRLLAQDPGISFQIMRTLSHRLRLANKEIESLTFENVLGRVASALLDLCSKYGESVAQGTRIKMPLSHQDIAELAGTGREVVSRTINRFRRLNCINYDNHHLIITNAKKLREFIY
ncbi:MAG: Crp/Fnr family transcriptional regulator [Elusimicrobiota bacterium]